MAKTKEKSKSQSAADFNKIIADGRERKRNEALASKIFSSRRQSLPAKSSSSSGGSLASRVGIKKPIARPLASKRRASVPSRGNINKDWTHDLHDNSSLSARISRAPTGPKAGTGTPKANGRATNGLKGAAGRAAALEAAIADPSQVNIVKPQPSLTIRGLAGPFTVLGQNFAPGTTPADVESAMTPVGGEMISCSVVKTQPFLIMEMVFASREGGERVIETFNNKTADGRVIKIFPKIGSGFQPPTGPRATRNAGQVVDGKHGFSEKGTAIGGNKRRGGKR